MTAPTATHRRCDAASRAPRRVAAHPALVLLVLLGLLVGGCLGRRPDPRGQPWCVRGGGGLPGAGQRRGGRSRWRRATPRRRSGRRSRRRTSWPAPTPSSTWPVADDRALGIQPGFYSMLAADVGRGSPGAAARPGRPSADRGRDPRGAAAHRDRRPARRGERRARARLRAGPARTPTGSGCPTTPRAAPRGSCSPRPTPSIRTPLRSTMLRAMVDRYEQAADGRRPRRGCCRRRVHAHARR